MNKNQIENIKKENCKKAQKYILKYLLELQLHLDLTENDMLKIIGCVHFELKKKNTTKKWWNFFKMK